MKTIRATLVTVALVIGANSLIAAPSNDWVDQWFKAKFGRSSPMEEARLKAEQESTAFRDEGTTGEAAPSAATWTEQYFKAKLGRSSPMEEARREAEQANTAFREEAPAGEAAPSTLNWTEQYLKAKLGRDIRIQKSGQKVQGGSGSEK